MCFLIIKVFSWSDVLPERLLMTRQCYCGHILKLLFKLIWDKNLEFARKKAEIVHHNARPHKTLLVQEILEETKMLVIGHPPWPPELSPCDFGCFQKSKIT